MSAMKKKKKGESKKKKKISVMPPGPTKEELNQLRLNLADADAQMKLLRTAARRLREANLYLEEEEAEAHNENVEYANEGARRLAARQERLAEARREAQRKEMETEARCQREVERLTEEKNLLQIKAEDKEGRLEKLRRLLLDHDHYIREEAERQKQLCDLEDKIFQTREQQEVKILALRREFLIQRRKKEQTFLKNVSGVQQLAARLVGPCVQSRMAIIASSNEKKAEELRNLIEKQKSMTAHHCQLQAKYSHLRREKELWDSLLDRAHRKKKLGCRRASFYESREDSSASVRDDQVGAYLMSKCPRLPGTNVLLSEMWKIINKPAPKKTNKVFKMSVPKL